MYTVNQIKAKILETFMSESVLAIIVQSTTNHIVIVSSVRMSRMIYSQAELLPQNFRVPNTMKDQPRVPT